MYDQKCYDLAVVFIDDDENLRTKPQSERDTLYHSLAQDIQNLIEDFLAGPGWES